MPPNKQNQAPLAWCGHFLVAFGVIAAIAFSAVALKSTDGDIPLSLCIIGSVLVALIGVLLVTHTQRTQPKLSVERDEEYPPEY